MGGKSAGTWSLRSDKELQSYRNLKRLKVIESNPRGKIQLLARMGKVGTLPQLGFKAQSTAPCTGTIFQETTEKVLQPQKQPSQRLKPQLVFERFAARVELAPFPKQCGFRLFPQSSRAQPKLSWPKPDLRLAARNLSEPIAIPPFSAFAREKSAGTGAKAGPPSDRNRA